MFSDFYRGKRVLVTGVAGVKGTWLALSLLEEGAEVRGIDIRQPASGSNFCASGLPSKLGFTLGDAADRTVLAPLVEWADCIFHLAAVALVYDAQRDPWETFRTNTLGVATVLEAARTATSLKRIVVVTTDKVYRPNDGTPWVESDPLGASGPYAVSKACAEFIAEDYYSKYLGKSGHRMATARAGNVILGGDPYTSSVTAGGGRIVPDCLEALAENRPPQIFSPQFTRPYTYGLDILSGYMTLMAKLDEDGISGEAFNFGPVEQYGVSNATLASKLCDLWGGPMWVGGAPRTEPFVLQSLSCSKSLQRLHWRPAFTLDQTLSCAVRWHRFWGEWQRDAHARDMHEFNRVLIREHGDAARDLGIEWALP